jgi:hypothetical protein
MGRCAARWLSVTLLAAVSACGSSAGERPNVGAGGSGGDSAGNAGAPSAGTGALAAGTSGAAGAGAGTGGVAGTSGGAGAGASSGGAGSAGEGGAGGIGMDLCPEAPEPRLASGTIVELPIELTFRGAALLFAEDNPLPGGGTLTPLGMRFYVSDVALLRDGADPLPVDIVTSTAAVAPYGVHLFNADDDASVTLRVLAPAGEYQGISFLWGLAQSCNTRTPESSSAPLSPTSEMTWPHTGFLFFRYEGRTAFPDPSGAGGASAGSSGAGGAGAGGASADNAGAGGATGGSAGKPGATYPSVIHMGGNLFEPLAPVIHIDAALSVPATGSVRQGLRVALDEIFEGALADVDLTDFVGPPGEEVLAGERLRRSVPTLSVFSLEP